MNITEKNITGENIVFWKVLFQIVMIDFEQPWQARFQAMT